MWQGSGPELVPWVAVGGQSWLRPSSGRRGSWVDEAGVDIAHLPLPYLMRMSRLRFSSLPSLNQR